MFLANDMADTVRKLHPVSLVLGCTQYTIQDYLLFRQDSEVNLADKSEKVDNLYFLRSLVESINAR